MSMRREWAFTKFRVTSDGKVVPTYATLIPNGHQFIRADLVRLRGTPRAKGRIPNAIWVKMKEGKVSTKSVTVWRKGLNKEKGWVKYIDFDLVPDGNYGEDPHHNGVDPDSLPMHWTTKELLAKEKRHGGVYNTGFHHTAARNWRYHPTHARYEIMRRAAGWK